MEPIEYSPIHEIKHPSAVYTEPLFSEMRNILQLINLNKKQPERSDVKQSDQWKKNKSFGGTKK